MAHFAKIENGIVTQVVVVDNEHEADGEAYLNGLGLEGKWVQTSYNGNFRCKFAALGDTYDEKNDWFISPKPADDGSGLEWIFSEEHHDWTHPDPAPEA